MRRMQPFQANRRYLETRVSETLGLLYADHFPYRQVETARDVRQSPVHDRLKAAGACFGEVSGWERANWFLPRAEQERDSNPVTNIAGSGRTGSTTAPRNIWLFASVWACSICRALVKIRVVGRDAEAVLQRIAANDVAVEPGKIVYTQFLNEAGRIEADVTRKPAVVRRVSGSNACGNRAA